MVPRLSSISRILTAELLILLLQFLTSVFLARYLGPEALGLYVILLLIPAYLEAIGRSYLDYSAVYFVANRKENLASVLYLVNFMSVIIVLVLTVAFVSYFGVIKQLLFSSTALDFTAMMGAAFLIFPLRLLYFTYSLMLQATQQFQKYNMMFIVQGVLTSFLIIVFTVIFEGSLLSLLLANVFGIIPTIIYGMIAIHKSHKLLVRFNSILLYEMVNVAIGQFIYNFVTFLKLNIGSLLLIFFSGPSQVAFYNIGKTIADGVTRLVPTAVNTVIYPEMSGQVDRDKTMPLLIESYRVILVFLVITAVPFLFISEVLVTSIYGLEFRSAVVPLNIMLISYVLYRASLIFASYFSAVGRTRALAGLMVPGPILQVGLFVGVFSDSGAYGATMSLLIGVCFTHIITLSYFIIFEDCKVSSFVPQSSDMKVLTGWLTGFAK